MKPLIYLNFARKVVLANFNKLKYPYKIFLVVTKSCGSRCTNCLIWKEVPDQEMTLEEYEKLSSNLGKNLSWLNISGGEPTNRFDLIEILKIFIKNCPNLLIINFTSNGLNPELLSDVANFLNKSGVPIIGINISVDGPEPIHLKLRGGTDSFKLAMISLKNIMAFKNLRIHASMTLFKSNAHLIKETLLGIREHLPDFKKKDFHLNYAFQSEHYYQNQSDISPYQHIEPPLPQRNLIKYFRPMEFVKNIYQKKLIVYYETKKNPMKCSALTSNVYISERGELYSCTIWNEKIGSLRENNYDLSSLLENEKALELKSMIAKNNCPNCWSPCEAYPSILDNLKDTFK